MKKKLSLIAALVTIIVGGIAIYQFWNPTDNVIEVVIPKPIKEPSLSEKLEGSYFLKSWVRTNRKIDLGIGINNGTLKVSSDGFFDWSVVLTQKHTPNPAKIRMMARGKFLISTMEVTGVEGGKYNKDIGIKGQPNWGNLSSSETLAVRGWTYQKPEDSFQISIDERTNGAFLMEMKNSWGVFTWKKKPEIKN